MNKGEAIIGGVKLHIAVDGNTEALDICGFR